MNSKKILLPVLILTAISSLSYMVGIKEAGAIAYCDQVGTPGIRIEFTGGASGTFTGNGSVTVPAGTVVSYNVKTYADPSSPNGITGPGANQNYPGPSSAGRNYGPVTINSNTSILVWIAQNCITPPDPPEKTISVGINIAASNGTVNVVSNRSSATWSISGPQNFSGTGNGSSTRPAGTYTINPQTVSGYRYSVGPGSTQTLSSGGSITFNITYTANTTSCNNNGIKESGEACDGSSFGSTTCTSLGFTGGSLSCSNCNISTSGCTNNPPPSGGSCGDGVVNSSEQCDNGSNNGACPRTCSTSCTRNTTCGGTCTVNASLTYITPPASYIYSNETNTFRVRITNTGNVRYAHGLWWRVQPTAGMTFPPGTVVPGTLEQIGDCPGGYTYTGCTGGYTEKDVTITAPDTPGSYTYSVVARHVWSVAGYDLAQNPYCPSGNGPDYSFGNTLSTTIPVIRRPVCSDAGPDSVTIDATSHYVYAYGVQNASQVLFATWSDLNGQDDIVWYSGTNMGGGTWRATIDFANHRPGNPDGGTFNVHVYMVNTVDPNSRIFCDTANFSRVAPRPNYTLESLTSSPASIVVGNTVTLRGTVRNSGTAGGGVASSTRLRLDVGNNGTYDQTLTNMTTNALGPNATEVEQWTWTAVLGTYKYEICADIGGAITESDETDNCEVGYFNVDNPPAPNYSVSGLATSPGGLTAGTAVTFSATVRNNGTTNATVSSSTRARIDVGNNGTYDQTFTNQTTNALAVNATEVENWTNAWTAVSGTHRFEVCADIANVITEQVESDNCTTQTFTVASAPVPVISLNGPFTFNAVQGSSPASQTLVISNTGNATLNWTGTDNQTWLTLGTGTGTIAAGGSQNVAINISSGALAVGTYTATITVSGTSATTRTVGVTLNVTAAAAPVISLNGPFTFTTNEGSSPASQTLIISNTGNATLNWTGTDNQTWLTLGTGTGTIAAGGSQNVAINISSATLVPGTYNATITVSGTSATTRTVGVTLTVNAVTAPAISLNGPFTFNAIQGSSPASQTLVVRNTGTATLNWTGTDNQTWLTLGTGSGTIAPSGSQNVVINISSATLAVGTYTATITVSGAPAASRTATVTLNITAVPTLGANLTASQTSGSTSISPTFTAQATGTVTGNINYNIWWNCADTGTSVSNAETACGLLPVASVGSCAVNAAGYKCLSVATNTLAVPAHTYTVGNYRAKLIVERGTYQAGDSVNITVSSQPAISLNGPFTFNATEGNNPASQLLVITNTGTATLNWTATTNQGWLTPFVLSGVIPAGGAQNVVLNITSSTMTAGTYSGIITISDPSASNNPQTAGVTLNISAAQPTISLNGPFSFNTTEGGANPSSQNLVISNTGTATLNWTATDNQAWLTLGTTSGSIPPAGSQNVLLSVNNSGLTYAGTPYTATITVTDPGATNSPRTAGVVVNVGSAPPVADVTCSDASAGIYSNGPCSVPYNTTAYLRWCGTSGTACSNATSCSVSPGGWTGTSNASQSTGNLTSSTTYTLSCTGPGGTDTDTVTVNVLAPIPAAANIEVQVLNSRYCEVGPHANVVWSYTDPLGRLQDGYRVQVRDTATNTVVHDSCVSSIDTCVPGGPASTNTEYLISTGGGLQFGRTYQASVSVRNTNGDWSTPATVMSMYCNDGSCSVADRWPTPIHSFPVPNFIFFPASPAVGLPVTFTDASSFCGGGSCGAVSSNRTWSWTFTGGSPGSSNVQAPPDVTYSSVGTWRASLTVSDDVGSCPAYEADLNVQKVIPRWREVAPR